MDRPIFKIRKVIDPEGGVIIHSRPGTHLRYRRRYPTRISVAQGCYIVTYPNGYQNWIDQKGFEEKYKPISSTDVEKTNKGANGEYYLYTINT
jgi:hypothetical protein